jgi:hypothetical protein
MGRRGDARRGRVAARRPDAACWPNANCSTAVEKNLLNDFDFEIDPKTFFARVRLSGRESGRDPPPGRRTHG